MNMKRIAAALLLLSVVAFTQNDPPASKTKWNGTIRNVTKNASGILITPTVTGLYRLSVYSDVETPDVLSDAPWTLNFGWFDGAGDENLDMQHLVSSQTRPAAYGTGPQVITFETAFQTPITYTITKGGTDAAVVDVFWTLELLQTTKE